MTDTPEVHDSGLLVHPYPCTFQTHASEWCQAAAFGPPLRPLCPDHGGPDFTVCESCDGVIHDDAEQFDCPRYSGPVHVGCHPRDCTSAECREALSDPSDYQG